MGAASAIVFVERLTRMETKLDNVIASKTTEHADLRGDVADHEARIRALEKVWWKTAGIAALVAGAVAAAASALIGNAIGAL